MEKRMILVLIMLLLGWSISLVVGEETVLTGKLNISSPVFMNKGTIPVKYTCNGANINPPLYIENVPVAAKSLALIVDDPDAPHGTWVHWVLWNIDPKTSAIKENSAPHGAKQGVNDFQNKTYDGPCPPSGTHRYFFELYALDDVLELGRDTKESDVSKAMKGHILGEGRLIGIYRGK